MKLYKTCPRKGYDKGVRISFKHETLQAYLDLELESTHAAVEEYEPIPVFWVAGHSKSGAVKYGEINEEFLERPVTTLIEDCKAELTVHFTTEQSLGRQKL